MPRYRNKKSGSIILMSLDAYNNLSKFDIDNFEAFENVEVKIPDVLKEIKEVTNIPQPKKRGRHAKV